MFSALLRPVECGAYSSGVSGKQKRSNLCVSQGCCVKMLWTSILGVVLWTIKRGNITQESIRHELAISEIGNASLTAKIITGDSCNLNSILKKNNVPMIDYVITSPPYWDMLRSKGAKTQSDRRDDEDLDVYYSNNANDLGNIADYDAFLEKLIAIYAALKPFLKTRAYLTIIVKNVKKGGVIYPLAWDIGKQLGKTYALKDERIWCQDNIPIFPYGMGNAWVSNTFHHYCLQFRNE